MRPFVDWIREPGFHIARGWSLTEGITGRGMYLLLSPMDRILGHCLTPKENGKLPYSTLILGRIKKSGKSEDLAAIGAWYADNAPEHSEMYYVANSEKQAVDRAFKNLQYHVEESGGRVLNTEIEFPNGTVAKVLPKVPRGVAGGQNDFVAFDELFGYTDERSMRMWTEMTLSPASRYPLRVIASYAGYENEQPNLLYDLYNLVILNGDVVPELADIVDRNGRPICYRSKDGSIFAMWDTEPRMPWQTPDYYAAEAVALTPMEFLRVHRNEWVSNEDQFMPIEWFDDAVARGEQLGLRGPLTMPNLLAQRNYPVCLGVDIGIKHDNSAVVGTYYDVKRQRIGLACSQIWAPTSANPIDLEHTVEAYVQEVCKSLHVISIAYDKTNFHRSMTTLKNKGLPMVEFSQQGQNMTKATKALYDAMKNGTFEAYPDPVLRDHVKFARAKAGPLGFCLAKDKYGRSKYPNDGAVALAMSVTESITRGGIDTTKKVTIRNPFSDMPNVSKSKYREDEMWLPEPLRSKQVV